MWEAEKIISYLHFMRIYNNIARHPIAYRPRTVRGCDEKENILTSSSLHDVSCLLDLPESGSITSERTQKWYSDGSHCGHIKHFPFIPQYFLRSFPFINMLTSTQSHAGWTVTRWNHSTLRLYVMKIRFEVVVYIGNQLFLQVVPVRKCSSTWIKLKNDRVRIKSQI